MVQHWMKTPQKQNKSRDVTEVYMNFRSKWVLGRLNEYKKYTDIKA